MTCTTHRDWLILMNWLTLRLADPTGGTKGDWLILVLTYYTAVMVPYNAAFSGKTVDDVGQLAADSVVDVVFFVDVLLNCHTSFVTTSGDVISGQSHVMHTMGKSFLSRHGSRVVGGVA